MEKDEIQAIKEINDSIGLLMIKVMDYLGAGIRSTSDMTFKEFIETEEWKEIRNSLFSISMKTSILMSTNKIYDSKEELEHLIFQLKCQLKILKLNESTKGQS